MAPISKRSISSTIEKQDENARLDRWLTKRFTYRSRAQWQELIKTGRILVNEKKCRSSKSLKHGDKIEFITDEYGQSFAYDVNINTNYNSEAEKRAGVLSAMDTQIQYLTSLL